MRCVYCDRETGTPYDEHAECVERSILESSTETDSPMTATENPGAYSLVPYAAHDGVPTHYRIRRDDLDGTTAGVIFRGAGGWILRRQREDSSYRSLGVYSTPEDAFAAYTKYTIPRV